MLLAAPAWGQVASRDFELSESDCIEPATTFDGSETVYSVVGWVKLESLPANSQHIWFGDTGVGADIGLSINFISSGTEARCTVRDTADNTQTVTASSSVSVDGNWHFMACVRNGDSVTAHYDDSSLTESDVSLGALSINALRIGCRAAGGPNTLFTDGLLAYVQVWDGRALSAAEVAGAARCPGSLVGSLAGYWPLTDSGTQYDQSGNGNNGAVGGTASSGNGPPVSHCAAGGN